MRAATEYLAVFTYDRCLSIHAAHAGCDFFCFSISWHSQFQSTQPMRAATSRQIEYELRYFAFQSTQPMRAATTLMSR